MSCGYHKHVLPLRVSAPHVRTTWYVPGICDPSCHPPACCCCCCLLPVTAASPLGSEEVYLTNTREDNSLAKTAKMLAFPPSSMAERLAVLLQPLAAQPPVSHLTSMALLEVVAALAVGTWLLGWFCVSCCADCNGFAAAKLAYAGTGGGSIGCRYVWACWVGLGSTCFCYAAGMTWIHGCMLKSCWPWLEQQSWCGTVGHPWGLVPALTA